MNYKVVRITEAQYNFIHTHGSEYEPFRLKLDKAMGTHTKANKKRAKLKKSK